MDLAFDRTSPALSGQLVPVAPGIRRIIAHNPGPFTFTGTCTYVVGEGDVSVIDPGPADEAHIAALLHALKGETIGRILITHTHRDHSPGARLLKARCDAPIIGCAPHHAARALLDDETNRLDASADHEHAPDRVLQHGESVEAQDHVLKALFTPGHTANHLAFSLEGRDMLFSGDHVMAWSTSIVAPPDGAMGLYMASLEALLTRNDHAFWPGHGGPVVEPRRFTRGLLTHRRQRETQIIERLALGPHSIPALVEANYPGLDARLKGAAALSVYAHLEDLHQQGRVTSDGPPRLEATYALV